MSLLKHAPPKIVHVLSNINGDLYSTVSKLMPSVSFKNIPCKGRVISDENLKLLQEEAEVLLCDPNVVNKFMYEIPNVKWVQVTFAGVDAMMSQIDKSKSNPSFLLTRFGGVFGPQMAEYVLGQILSRERNFKEMAEFQKRKDWDQQPFRNYRPLSTLCIAVLGIGDIGMEVARICSAFHMKVIGIVRKTPDKKSDFISQYVCVENLSDALKQADYLCSILPNTPQTANILDGDALESCKEKRTVLINVGRGNVISDAALQRALSQNWLGGAILDVFNTEPLPGDSPLWTTQGVSISPHVATMSFDWQVAEMFKENYRRYIEGEPLKYTVDVEKGY